MSLSLFVPLEPLVNKEHAYRKFLQLLDFEGLTKPLSALENTEVGRHGYALSIRKRRIINKKILFLGNLRVLNLQL